MQLERKLTGYLADHVQDSAVFASLYLSAMTTLGASWYNGGYPLVLLNELIFMWTQVRTHLVGFQAFPFSDTKHRLSVHLREENVVLVAQSSGNWNHDLTNVGRLSKRGFGASERLYPEEERRCSDPLGELGTRVSRPCREFPLSIRCSRISNR